MSPRVSVIIPAFNAARFIKRAIESVLAQTCKDFEVLVIDDGSSDPTCPEVMPFLSNKALRFIRQEQAGPSVARNRGIEKSRGEFISFLDSDDIYFPNRIEEGLKALDGDKKADICYSNEIFFFEDNSEKYIESPHPKFSGDIFFYLKRSNFIHTSTVLARRRLFTKWNFDKDLKNHEDWDFFLKASSSGVKFHYIAKPLAKVNVRQEGLTSTSPEWAESRRIVGERARALWRDLKKEDFIRCISLKAKAALVNFPTSERFNKKMPHGLLGELGA